MNHQPSEMSPVLLDIRSLWDHLPTEVYLLDAQTCQIIDANNRACANMQYTREEFQRLRLVDISPSYTPEFLTQIGIPLGEGTDQDVVFETERRRKDGSMYWSEVRVGRIHTGGQPVMTSIVTDISARKRAQDELFETRERLLRMVTTVDMGAWEWNVETNELLLCPTVNRLLGCAPDVALRSLDDLLLRLHTDDQAVFRATVQYQAKKAGRNTFRFPKSRPETAVVGHLGKPQEPPASAPIQPGAAVDAGLAHDAAASHPTIAKFIAASGAPESGTFGHFLADAVAVIREHLQMDVAFISEFSEGQRKFRYVDSANGNPPVQAGGSSPLEESYCLRVIDGRLPELIPDAFDFPAALELPATTALPVRAHISVPIRLQDGRVYGTLCCFSNTPDHSLNQRDVQMMRVFADIAARQIGKERAAEEAYDRSRTRIQSLLSNDALTIVYQPICDVGQNRIVGFEALSRFSAEPTRTPDVWFAEAASVGLGIELEIKAIEKALAGLSALPSDVYVSINASPDTIISGELERVLERAPHQRIVLEITEHNFINEYLKVAEMLRPLRALGLRVAVDDAGAGYASFRHILKLAPELIKLDMSITRGIDCNSSCRALASALIRFAHETECVIVAEGVETAAELQTLQALGVTQVQGNFLGRPAPLGQAAQSCRTGIKLPKQTMP